MLTQSVYSCNNFITCRNQYAIAELLIQAGADVNKKNAVGIYPIMVAAALGHHKVLKVMANAKGANLGNQVLDTLVVLAC